jgi:hypothetical protein
MIVEAMLLAERGSWLAVAAWSIIAVLVVLLAHFALSRTGRDDIQPARTRPSGPSTAPVPPTDRDGDGRPVRQEPPD